MVAMQYNIADLAADMVAGWVLHQHLPQPVVLLVQVPDQGDVLQLPGFELLVQGLC